MDDTSGSLFFELFSDLVADVLDEVFGQPYSLVEQSDLLFDVGPPLNK